MGITNLQSACARAMLLFCAAIAMLGDANAGSLRLSADGSLVVEGEGSLSWSRCVEGSHWDGKTCSGTPLLMTRDEAIALARARNAAQPALASGVKSGLWRLPRVPELRRLAQEARSKTRVRGELPGGLDAQLFPASPGGLYWSLTSQVDTAPVNPYNYSNITEGRRPDNANSIAFLHGWAVDMDSGEAKSLVPKRTRLPVRLLWTQP